MMDSKFYQTSAIKSTIFGFVCFYLPVGVRSNFCEEIGSEDTSKPPTIGDGLDFGSACLILFFFGCFALLLAWMFNLIRSYIYNDRVSIVKPWSSVVIIFSIATQYNID